MWKSFFKEMEKRSNLFGTALVGGLSALDVKNTVGQKENAMKLDEPERGSQFNISSPNDYQFEGGKHTNLKETKSPHVSLYN